MSVLYPITADPRFRLTTATAGQTTFSVPFFFQDNADVVVIRIDGNTGLQTTLTEGVHYSLTGALEVAGGTVTLAAGATAGDIYLRVGQAVLDRVTSITRAGKFRSEALDNDIDRFVLIAQELYRELERVPKSAYGVTPPELSAGADNTLAVWRNGNLEEGPNWEDAGGIPGPGLSTGGAQWQVPVKLSGVDYHTEWMNLPFEHLDFSGIDPKATPVDADTLLGFDSEDSAAPKTFSFSAIMTWIRAQFAGAALALAGGGTGRSLVAPTTDALLGYDLRQAQSRFMGVTELLPKGVLWGFGTGNNAGDPTNDIDIQPGAVVDSTGTYVIRLTSAVTRRLDGTSFTTGNGGVMRDTGAIANGTWHLFAILNPTTGDVQVLASLSISAPTLPSGYTVFGRIESIIRSGGVIRGYLRDGDKVMQKVPVNDLDITAPGTSAVALNVSTPANLSVDAILAVYYGDSASAASSSILLTDLRQPDTAPSTTIYTLRQGVAVGTDPAFTSAVVQVRTSAAANAQIRYRAEHSDAGVTLRITTLGWIDARGRND